MALISAFFPAKKLVSLESTASDNSTVYLEIDVVRVIDHSRGATVTSFPIESGANISDHAILSNNKLEMQCVVSGNPFDFINTAREVFDIDQIRNPLSVIEKSKRLIRQLGTVGKILQTNESRIENSFRYLSELHRNRNPIRIVTDYELYENMVMTDFNVTQNTQSGDSLNFNATFEQIKIITNQLVIASIESKVSDEYKSSAKKSTKLGKQNADEPSTPIKDKGASVLVKLSRFF